MKIQWQVTFTEDNPQIREVLKKATDKARSGQERINGSAADEARR
jgi:hypothetical protein